MQVYTPWNRFEPANPNPRSISPYSPPISRKSQLNGVFWIFFLILFSLFLAQSFEPGLIYFICFTLASEVEVSQEQKEEAQVQAQPVEEYELIEIVNSQELAINKETDEGEEVELYEVEDTWN